MADVTTTGNSKKTPPLMIDENRDDVMILGAGFAITGDIIGDGAVIIAGNIKGDILAKKVLIAPGGSVSGKVTAMQLEVQGRVEGITSATEIIVRKNGKLEGQILCTTLETERGGDVIGDIKRSPPTEFSLRKDVGNQSGDVKLKTKDILFQVNLPEPMLLAIVRNTNAPAIVMGDDSPAPPWLKFDGISKALVIEKSQAFIDFQKKSKSVAVKLKLDSESYDLTIPIDSI
jgi:cytoskeletal protein CcmA (bactofilin family)